MAECNVQLCELVEVGSATLDGVEPGQRARCASVKASVEQKHLEGNHVVEKVEPNSPHRGKSVEVPEAALDER
jgi:hypothetical protein